MESNRWRVCSFKNRVFNSNSCTSDHKLVLTESVSFLILEPNVNRYVDVSDRQRYQRRLLKPASQLARSLTIISTTHSTNAADSAAPLLSRKYNDNDKQFKRDN